ncbi:MAG: hypothetical protein HYZ75_06990 [Elusimicrobia bacterium]|nr:hypothetical protein [Elusimicrobiota bacterium]
MGIPALVLSFGVALAHAESAETLTIVASDVAVEVSSMVSTATPAGVLPTISVQEFSGPAERAALVTHQVRAKLLQMGISVLAPDALAEYDLRGALLGVDGGTLLTASLWRHGTKALVGTMHRELSKGASDRFEIQGARTPPISPDEEPGSEKTRRRSFWINVGLAENSAKDNWSAGVAYRPAVPWWEAALDVGQFNEAETDRTRIPGLFGFVGSERFQLHATFVQVRCSYLHQFDWKYLSYLRAALGARLLFLEQEHEQSGLGRASSTSHVERLQPVFQIGAAKSLWGDVELEARAEFTPTVRAVGAIKYGGFAGLALLGIRLPL